MNFQPHIWQRKNSRTRKRNVLRREVPGIPRLLSPPRLPAGPVWGGPGALGGLSCLFAASWLRLARDLRGNQTVAGDSTCRPRAAYQAPQELAAADASLQGEVNCFSPEVFTIHLLGTFCRGSVVSVLFGVVSRGRERSKRGRQRWAPAWWGRGAWHGSDQGLPPRKCPLGSPRCVGWHAPENRARKGGPAVAQCSFEGCWGSPASPQPSLAHLTPP